MGAAGVAMEEGHWGENGDGGRRGRGGGGGEKGEKDAELKAVNGYADMFCTLKHVPSSVHTDA